MSQNFNRIFVFAMTLIVDYVGCCESNSLHKDTILWYERTHECVFEQQASVTVNFDKCRVCIFEPKGVDQKHTSEFASSQNCFRVNELRCSIQRILVYCLLMRKLTITWLFFKNTTGSTSFFVERKHFLSMAKKIYWPTSHLILFPSQWITLQHPTYSGWLLHGCTTKILHESPFFFVKRKTLSLL